MFLNKKPSEYYNDHATKALMKLSQLLKDIKNYDLSSIEESELPPSSILFRELSKPVLDPKKLNHIIAKGTPPKIKNHIEERDIKLILEKIKQYKGYEQLITLHKISDKSLMIMAAIGIIEQYKKGDTIYAKKDIADKFYYIIKGNVMVKAFDQKKIVSEYENRIQEYKIKNTNNIKRYDNFINTYNKNIYLIESQKQSSQINSFNSISGSISNNGNSDSFSDIFNKSKDLLHNKMQKLEKVKSISLHKNSQFILNNFTNKKIRNELILSKRRKPLFYIQNNNDNDNKYKLIENDINNNNNNNSNEQKDIFIKSFSELQDFLKEQRDQGLTINEYSEGNFFGEWELMYKKYRQNTAYTTEDTDLLILDLSYFKDYFKNEMLLADFERKFFLKKIVPILNINYMPIMVPIFYSKGDVVYTEYDIATYFYIIYKGSGALKQLKIAKNKKDIMLNLNKLETLMIIDKGCIVGLECCKSFNKENDNIYYDNTFIINEQNTLVYRINLAKFKINKEEMIKLKIWMKDLYQKQCRLIKSYKEKLSKPKISREMILKHIDKNSKKIYFYRDLNKNIIQNKIAKINDFPVKRESININASFSKKKLYLTNEDNNYYPKFISNYKSYSNRSSNSNIDSSSGLSNSNSKSITKSTKRSSNINNNTISPFVINDEFIPKKKSINPINKRNLNESNFNTLFNTKNIFTYTSCENNNENNAFNNKMNKLWNSKTKEKNNNNKTNFSKSLKKLKYDDSFYKLIFKKHYRKISISSIKKGGKKKVNLFLYDSGQFDIPLLAFSSKKKKDKKSNL